MTSKASTTIITTRGQVALPKALREARRWAPGTRLIMEETAAGVLLRTEPTRPETTLDQVFGSLSRGGPARTIEEMEAGLAAEAKRHAGD